MISSNPPTATEKPKEKTKRLSRWEPEPGRVTIVLTGDDDIIFRALRDHPYLTREELALATGRSGQTLGRRLTKLVHSGNVLRKYWFNRPVGYGSPPALYALAPLACERIAEDAEDLDRLRQRAYLRERAGARHFDHIHAISFFRLTLTRAFHERSGSGSSTGLRSFTIEQDDPELAVQVSLDGRPVVVWPDASFRVGGEEGGEGGSYTYLVEIDRAGAERKRSRIEQRFRAYWQYVKVDKKLLEKTRHVGGAFVLFVLPNETMRERYRRIAVDTADIDASARTFLFLSWTDINPAQPTGLLTEPLCRTLRGEPFRLVPGG